MLSVDLQQCDSAAVPLPSPCDRVVSQVASATSLIKRRLDEAAARRYMLVACVFHRRSRTCVRVHMFFRRSRRVSAFNKGPRARREHTTLSDKFLALAAG